MKKIAGLVAVAFLVTAASAHAQKITTDYDHDANLDNYQTYMWSKGTPVSNPLMDQRVVSSIESELASKGIQKVDSNPSMYVVYHASSKENQSFQTDSFGYGMGAGWRWGGMGGMGTSTTREVSYTKGTLVVDFWDAGTKKLVWRGTATDTLSDKPEKNSKKIVKAMEKLFKKYPPKK